MSDIFGYIMRLTSSIANPLQDVTKGPHATDVGNKEYEFYHVSMLASKG